MPQGARLKAVDLADVSDLGTGKSEDLGHKSEDSGLQSEDLGGKSEGLGAAKVATTDDDPTADLELLALAEGIRSSGKAKKEVIHQAILDLCRKQFLDLNQLAALLGRSTGDLRQRFVKPMVEDGLLVRRFPQQPNHVHQAYRAKGE